ESGTNTGDVQRGHYSFATKTFTHNDSLESTDLWEVSEEDLDADPDFINAVRVVARRDQAPVASFFAGIFGFDSFNASAEAIAYIGFAGNLRPQDVDQPIAICSEALRDGDSYTCSIGRMINSGGSSETSNTGGWTSFNQVDPCQGGTNASEMNGLICAGGNPESITLGQDIATNGGQIQSAFKSFYKCWEQHSQDKTQPWEITLPVIECSGNNVGTCERVVGAVNVTIIWINDKNDPNYTNAPEEMGNWPTSDDVVDYDLSDGEQRWTSFVEHFNLKNLSDDSQTGFEPAPYAQKSIYFLPDCEPHEPKGATGGENFGILAQIPVLVK
ncbi:MAG: TadG family pilus assembly protein, partial [Desulfosalsimonas sp.]